MMCHHPFVSDLLTDHLYEPAARVRSILRRGIETSACCPNINDKQYGFDKGRTYLRALTLINVINDRLQSFSNKWCFDLTSKYTTREIFVELFRANLEQQITVIIKQRPDINVSPTNNR